MAHPRVNDWTRCIYPLANIQVRDFFAYLFLFRRRKLVHALSSGLVPRFVGDGVYVHCRVPVAVSTASSNIKGGLSTVDIEPSNLVENNACGLFSKELHCAYLVGQSVSKTTHISPWNTTLGGQN